MSDSDKDYIKTRENAINGVVLMNRIIESELAHIRKLEKDILDLLEERSKLYWKVAKLEHKNKQQRKRYRRKLKLATNVSTNDNKQDINKSV